MKFKNARTAVAAVAFAALAVCLIAGVATGTWCGFGANDIAVLCPVGALLSMVAAKTLIPRAVLSIVVAIGATVLGGVIGILMGYGLSSVATMVVTRLMEETLTVAPSVGAVIMAFGISVGIGVLFGYLPAKKAAALNPIDALRYE